MALWLKYTHSKRNTKSVGKWHKWNSRKKTTKRKAEPREKYCPHIVLPVKEVKTLAELLNDCGIEYER